MMKKQVILLATNGSYLRPSNEYIASRDCVLALESEGISPGFHKISDLEQSAVAELPKDIPNLSGVHDTEIGRRYLQTMIRDEGAENLALQMNKGETQSKGEVVAETKNKKKQRNKSKTQFQIKNVLQQICSSIQNCLKDSYVPQLTPEYWQKTEVKLQFPSQPTPSAQQMITTMQGYLNNPSQHNIGCLMKMDGIVHMGLHSIFSSRILKKYIQCSKIRTLKQKAICLEAVDYLYRCFKEQKLCSLHTWAHRREQKIAKRKQKYHEIYRICKN